MTAAIVSLLPPRLHHLKSRIRDLEALRRRVDAEICALKDELTAQQPAPRRGPTAVVLRKPCGTEEGYQWHRRFDPSNWPLPKGDPCGCRAAHSAYERARVARKREVSEAC